MEDGLLWWMLVIWSIAMNPFSLITTRECLFCTYGNRFDSFQWVVDFAMYEEESGRWTDGAGSICITTDSGLQWWRKTWQWKTNLMIYQSVYILTLTYRHKFQKNEIAVLIRPLTSLSAMTEPQLCKNKTCGHRFSFHFFCNLPQPFFPFPSLRTASWPPPFYSDHFWLGINEQLNWNWRCSYI